MATINFDSPNDTICAISTPPGIGGIAVIRISGSDAIPIADSIFTSVHPGKTLGNQPANKALFGTIHDQDNIIDEVIATLKGIKCRSNTSCGDQLALALEDYKRRKSY